MGVLYDVLFKPIGRGDGSTPADPANDGHANNNVPPEWVLDERDGGSLVWRRYGAAASCRRRVEFLDAVEVRVYERDDYGTGADAVTSSPPPPPSSCDEDDQLCWADDFSTWDDDDTKTLFYRRQPSDCDGYPVLVAVSVTVLGLCIGLVYIFAPVKWLLHQLLVD